VSTPGSVYIQDETFNGGSSYATAASSPNYLAQWVSGSHLQSYTLNFSAPLQSLSFVSCAIGSSSSVAGWSATAYDSSNTQVDSASSSGGNGPAQTWTLSGANPIAYLTITADGGGVAGIPSPPLDNFDLVEAVPEPGTAWVGAAVLLAAFFWRRRVRSARV
jgi:MYXO-CTERM domain-containing protein